MTKNSGEEETKKLNCYDMHFYNLSKKDFEELEAKMKNKEGIINIPTAIMVIMHNQAVLNSKLNQLLNK